MKTAPTPNRSLQAVRIDPAGQPRSYTHGQQHVTVVPLRIRRRQ